MTVTADEIKGMKPEEIAELFNGMNTNLERLTKQVEFLTEALVTERNGRFGRSTEKNLVAAEENGQQSFFNEAEASCDKAAAEVTIEEVVPSYRRKRPAGKKEQDLSQFPRKELPVHKIEEEKLKELFPEGYSTLPKETYERLVYQPAEYYVEVHTVEVYKSKKVPGKIVRAPYPKSLLKGSVVTPSLAAAVINGKYTNAMPLYRMEQEFSRNDIHISRQTMANWIIRLAEDYLSVFCDRMKEHLLEAPVLQADETTVKVNKDGRKAGTHSYMWVYRTATTYPEKTVVLYDYQKTRGETHPEEFLKDYEGVLLTDGYQAYHTLEKKAEKIQVAGCWAHARRKFADAIKAAGKNKSGTVAEEALRRIQQIYNADKQLAGLPFDEVVSRRRIEVAPHVDSFFEWIRTKKNDVTPKSNTGKGITYCLNQEMYLRVFLEHGDVPIDNNAAERAIRPFTTGRKNWVMIDTVNGANASATMYSLVETAKANDLKIYDYICYLLTQLPSFMDGPLSNLDDLMPWSDKIPDDCRKPKPTPQTNSETSEEAT